ncbi:hypothetical protein Lal_00038571 [Lupinus albus]|nr:hypothetical protein Lal_00038571 [Lupinus albus]
MEDQLVVLRASNLGGKELKYLTYRIQVGANPRGYATWKSVVDSLARRVASWKCRYISFGGRLVFLSSVVTSIPIFMLSLYKALKKEPI